MKKNDDCPLPTAHSLLALLTTLSLLTALAVPTHATDITLGDHKFTLPDGFTIEQVAGPPLVNRPICADFDEQGRLYVADSSGSNENVQTQLEQKPHRIVRLEDTDGDGTFDESVVFAASMMFPEGAMWFDGSLYVSAPPVIWKLTDTDGDGEADKHEEWLDAKTLTGCANDLHGPYLGPDGWIYWCKGAFAEQTYERPGREPFVTRASHIFRRRPEGGPIEPVMTGGMDNPVEVVFTPGGERIQWATFTPTGGQMTSMNGTGGAAGTTYNLSLGKWDDGVVSIFANAPGGQALANMRVSVAKIGGASDQEVFGPGGQVALHGFGRTAKGTVLMNDVQKANPAPRGRRFVNSPVQIQASSKTLLYGVHIEMRIPMTGKGPMISSIRPTGLLIHKWDEAKKSWVPLSGGSTNAGWGMVSAPMSGPGMYAVTTSGSGNELLELLATNIF